MDAIAAHVLTTLEDRGDLNSDAWLSVDESAAYIRAPSRQRVYDLISDRRLVPAGRDGRKPLFRRSQLDAYLERGALA